MVEVIARFYFLAVRGTRPSISSQRPPHRIGVWYQAQNFYVSGFLVGRPVTVAHRRFRGADFDRWRVHRRAAGREPNREPYTAGHDHDNHQGG